MSDFKNLILIDTNIDSRQRLSQHLRTKGYSVLEVSTNKEALKNTTPCDGIITADDLLTPLIEQLPNTPIVALTSSFSKTPLSNQVQVIHKPILFKEVEKALEQSLNQATQGDFQRVKSYMHTEILIQVSNNETSEAVDKIINETKPWGHLSEEEEIKISSTLKESLEQASNPTLLRLNLSENLFSILIEANETIFQTDRFYTLFDRIEEQKGQLLLVKIFNRGQTNSI